MERLTSGKSSTDGGQSAVNAETNNNVTSSQQPRQPGRPGRSPAAQRPGLGRAALASSGAVVGIVTALVALGAAQLIAAVLSSPIGAPVAAVGELSINHAPSAVKNFAIREFGSSDKTVLVWGIRGVLIIFAAVIGILAVRKLWHGMVGLAVFGAIGVYAALSQPRSTATDVLPSLIGAVVASFALRYFASLGTRLAGSRGSGARTAQPRPAPHGPPRIDSAQPGAAWAPFAAGGRSSRPGAARATWCQTAAGSCSAARPRPRSP
jgi:hypothetical protein